VKSNRPSRKRIKKCVICSREFYPQSSEKECSSLCYIKNRVQIDDHGCWIMQVGKRESGKCRILFDKKRIPAHIASYTICNAEIPKGSEVRQTCKNLDCCNPEHLFLNEKPMQTYIRENSTPNENGCWIWNLAKSTRGYGKCLFKALGAHRVSYEAFKGKIPKEKYVCHKCDVKACVNPDHLWVGTCKENVQDAKSKGRLPDQRGLNSKSAKLTESQVKEIRALKGKVTYEKIGKIYNIATMAAWKVANFKSYKNIIS
jgi:hypothetical protein